MGRQGNAGRTWRAVAMLSVQRDKKAAFFSSVPLQSNQSLRAWDDGA